MRSNVDFSPFYWSSISFDRIFNLLENSGHLQGSSEKWPPMAAPSAEISAQSLVYSTGPIERRPQLARPLLVEIYDRRCSHRRCCDEDHLTIRCQVAGLDVGAVDLQSATLDVSGVAIGLGLRIYQRTKSNLNEPLN